MSITHKTARLWRRMTALVVMSLFSVNSLVWADPDVFLQPPLYTVCANGNDRIEVALAVYLRSLDRPIENIDFHLFPVIKGKRVDLFFDSPNKRREGDKWIVPALVDSKNCEAVIDAEFNIALRDVPNTTPPAQAKPLDLSAYSSLTADTARLAAVDAVFSDLDGVDKAHPEKAVGRDILASKERLSREGVRLGTISGRPSEEAITLFGGKSGLAALSATNPYLLIGSTGGEGLEINPDGSSAAIDTLGDNRTLDDASLTLLKNIATGAVTIAAREAVFPVECVMASKIVSSPRFVSVRTLAEPRLNSLRPRIAELIIKRLSELPENSPLRNLNVLISAGAVDITISNKGEAAIRMIKLHKLKSVVLAADSVGTALEPGNDRSMLALTPKILKTAGIDWPVDLIKIYVGREDSAEIPEGVIIAPQGQSETEPALALYGAIAAAKEKKLASLDPSNIDVMSWAGRLRPIKELTWDDREEVALYFRGLAGKFHLHLRLSKWPDAERLKSLANGKTPSEYYNSLSADLDVSNSRDFSKDAVKFMHVFFDKNIPGAVWFDQIDQAEEIAQYVASLLKKDPSRTVTILDYGTANGEEALSLAVILDNRFREQYPLAKIVVIGRDLQAPNAKMLNWIDPDILPKEIALNADRYFTRIGDTFIPRPETLAMVRLSAGNIINIAKDTPAGDLPANAVIINNVLGAYVKIGSGLENAIEAISGSLAPGGRLYVNNSLYRDIRVWSACNDTLKKSDERTDGLRKLTNEIYEKKGRAAAADASISPAPAGTAVTHTDSSTFFPTAGTLALAEELSRNGRLSIRISGSAYTFTFEAMPFWGAGMTDNFRIRVLHENNPVGLIDTAANVISSSFDGHDDPALFLETGYRDKGLGRALLALAMGVSRNKGYNEFHVIKSTPQGEGMYAAMGFALTNKNKYGNDYYFDMTKPLPTVWSRKKTSPDGSPRHTAGLSDNPSDMPAIALIRNNGKWETAALSSDAHRIINQAWKELWDEGYELPESHDIYQAVKNELDTIGMPELPIHIHSPPARMLYDKIYSVADTMGKISSLPPRDRLRVITHPGTFRDDDSNPRSYNLLIPAEELMTLREIKRVSPDAFSEWLDHEVSHLADRAAKARGAEKSEEMILDSHGIGKFMAQLLAKPYTPRPDTSVFAAPKKDIVDPTSAVQEAEVALRSGPVDKVVRQKFVTALKQFARDTRYPFGVEHETVVRLFELMISRIWSADENTLSELSILAHSLRGESGLPRCEALIEITMAEIDRKRTREFGGLNDIKHIRALDSMASVRQLAAGHEKAAVTAAEARIQAKDVTTVNTVADIYVNLRDYILLKNGVLDPPPSKRRVFGGLLISPGDLAADIRKDMVGAELVRRVNGELTLHRYNVDMARTMPFFAAAVDRSGIPIRMVIKNKSTVLEVDHVPHKTGNALLGTLHFQVVRVIEGERYIYIYNIKGTDMHDFVMEIRSLSPDERKKFFFALGVAANEAYLLGMEDRAHNMIVRKERLKAFSCEELLTVGKKAIMNIDRENALTPEYLRLDPDKDTSETVATFLKLTHYVQMEDAVFFGEHLKDYVEGFKAGWKTTRDYYRENITTVDERITGLAGDIAPGILQRLRISDDVMTRTADNIGRSIDSALPFYIRGYKKIYAERLEIITPPDGSPWKIASLLKTEFARNGATVADISSVTKGRADGHLSSKTVLRNLVTLISLNLVTQEAEKGQAPRYRVTRLSDGEWGTIEPILMRLGDRPTSAMKDAAKADIKLSVPRLGKKDDADPELSPLGGSPEKITDVAPLIRRIEEEVKTKRRVIVLVDGDPGTGKTSIIAAGIQRRFSGCRVISLDRYVIEGVRNGLHTEHLYADLAQAIGSGVVVFEGPNLQFAINAMNNLYSFLSNDFIGDNFINTVPICVRASSESDDSRRFFVRRSSESEEVEKNRLDCRQRLDLQYGYDFHFVRPAGGDPALEPRPRMGKRAKAVYIARENQRAVVEYPKGNYTCLELVPRGGMPVTSLIEYVTAMNNVASEHKEMIIEMLNIVKDLPVKLFTFEELIEDLHGFAAPTNNLIAVHTSLSGVPAVSSDDGSAGKGWIFDDLSAIALTHEIGEYLAAAGLISLDLNDNVLNINMNGHVRSIKLGDKAPEALTIAKKDPASVHYLLRAGGREVFGQKDADLTKEIKKWSRSASRTADFEGEAEELPPTDWTADQRNTPATDKLTVRLDTHFGRITVLEDDGTSKRVVKLRVVKASDLTDEGRDRAALSLLKWLSSNDPVVTYTAAVGNFISRLYADDQQKLSKLLFVLSENEENENFVEGWVDLSSKRACIMEIAPWNRTPHGGHNGEIEKKVYKGMGGQLRALALKILLKRYGADLFSPQRIGMVITLGDRGKTHDNLFITATYDTVMAYIRKKAAEVALLKKQLGEHEIAREEDSLESAQDSNSPKHALDHNPNTPETAAYSERWTLSSSAHSGMKAKMQLLSDGTVKVEASALITEEGITVQYQGARNDRLPDQTHTLRRLFARAREIALASNMNPKWAFVYVLSGPPDTLPDMEGLPLLMKHLGFASRRNLSSEAPEFQMDDDLKAIISWTMPPGVMADNDHYWAMPLEPLSTISVRRLESTGYMPHDARVLVGTSDGTVPLTDITKRWHDPATPAAQAKKPVQNENPLVLRDLRDKKSMAECLAEEILSMTINKKVVLAFDTGLAGGRAGGALSIFEELIELKRTKKFGKALNNLEIVIAPASDLAAEIEKHRSGDTQVFLFAPSASQKTLKTLETITRSSYIDEEGFANEAYYPLAEIVAISLAQLSDNCVSLNAILNVILTREGNISLAALNIESVTNNGKNLIFKLLPNATPCTTPGELIQHYATIKRFLKAA